MPDLLAERAGLGHSLRELPANLQLRCCVGRTGFERPCHTRPEKQKAPFGGILIFLAVERVLSERCSAEALTIFHGGREVFW